MAGPRCPAAPAAGWSGNGADDGLRGRAEGGFVQPRLGLGGGDLAGQALLLLALGLLDGVGEDPGGPVSSFLAGLFGHGVGLPAGIGKDAVGLRPGRIEDPFGLALGLDHFLNHVAHRSVPACGP